MTLHLGNPVLFYSGLALFVVLTPYMVLRAARWWGAREERGYDALRDGLLDQEGCS